MRTELLLRRVVSATCLLCAWFLCNVVVAVPAGIPCDYNNNGVCDAADVVLWRNGGPLENDSTPGVQPHDYEVWKAGFGQTSGSGSISLGNDLVAIPSLDCDYNDNGVCDAADHVVWKNTVGQQVSPYTGGDGDGNGLVDSADYIIWKSGYGVSMAGSGGIAAAPQHVAVPEPTSAALLLLAVAGAAVSSRHRTH